MKWIEMTVFTTEQGLDAVAARFDMLGIQQVMIEQGRESIEAFLKETAKYWDYADTDELVAGEEPCVKAYLADAGENMELVHLAEASFDALRKTDVGIDLGSLRFVVRLADDEDWANNWKAYYKPLKIGSRLLVRPSWEALADAEGRTVLSLDPGMAFGTGTHETTRLCATLVEEHMKPGAKVLDLGTGSGILAIAASKLGAGSVNAYDIDPVAVRVAEENCLENSCLNIKCGISDLLAGVEMPEGGFDFVCANIVADIIVRMAPDIAKYMRDGGLLAVSGIIDTQADRVRRALEDGGLTLVRVTAENDWKAMLFARLFVAK